MLDKIADIKNALSNKTYIAAISLALTLPDICSQIEHKTSESSKTNYINWVDGHFPPEYFNTCFNGFEEQTFTGNMCYSLRCSVLHSGSTDVKSTRLQVSVDKFVLTKPGDDKYYKGYTYSEETQDDGSMIKTTYIAIDYLCECLCDVAEEFYNNWPDKAAFDDHIFAKSDT